MIVDVFQGIVWRSQLNHVLVVWPIVLDVMITQHSQSQENLMIINCTMLKFAMELFRSVVSNDNLSSNNLGFYNQLCEGLTFLHNEVKLFHRNLCPESVIINSNGAWKLSGFELCIQGSADGVSLFFFALIHLTTILIRQTIRFENTMEISLQSSIRHWIS